MVKDRSPFTPGTPVPVEFFVGRAQQIELILKLSDQVRQGKQENVFLSGDRGIGKSSLAAFVRRYVNTKKEMIGVQISLGRVTSLEELVRHVFDQILKETRGQGVFDKIKALFGDHVTSVGLFDISVNFQPPTAKLQELVRNFPTALSRLVESLRDDKKGLFVALDEINGFAESREFADWFKSCIDEIATHHPDFPVMFMLIGLREKRDSLAKLQPSLLRIFRPVDVQALSDDEIRQFYSRTFQSVGIEVDPPAMAILTEFSSGLPTMMQEIGDAAFWRDQDGRIDADDAADAIVEAGMRVGEKYLNPKVYAVIRSKDYRAILRKMGKLQLRFKKRDLASLLSEREKRAFTNFLHRMVGLGVIRPDVEEGRGAYIFTNALYRIAILAESIESQKRHR